jgi:hypothetical protein
VTEAPVFLFASGLRCGSTLLQRLLNSHPDLLIWGEQDGFLNRFVPAHLALLDWQREYHAQRDEFLAFGYDTFSANMLPTDADLTEAASAFVRALFADPARRLGRPRWGCKEVRCDAAIASFLLDLFPAASIVHLTRDPVNCFLSLQEWEASPDRWSRTDTEATLADWARINASFADGATAPPHLSLRYEDMTAAECQETAVADLTTFTGLDPKFLDRGVFNLRLHREGNEGRARRQLPGRESLTEHDRALLLRSPLPEIAAEYGYQIRFA